jgi:lipid II isoglutaminyl synthase (glutamine-hydrolysing)
MKLQIGHLYPELMNIYADRGNVECLRRRCEWRGIEADVRAITAGATFAADELDIIILGGGQDRQQRAASDDLQEATGDSVRGAVEAGAVLLGICGGYQLLGSAYVDADGTKLIGLGLLDMETRHPGFEAARCIGNIAVEWSGGTLVGFENHGGRTYPGRTAVPLGRVLAGGGNNAEDGTEGSVRDRVFGTYLHGSLLPKNPHFADHLLQLAIDRRDAGFALEPLDDAEEWAAHRAALALLGIRQGE